MNKVDETFGNLVLLGSLDVGVRVRLDFSDDEVRSWEDGVVLDKDVVMLDNGDCFNFKGEDLMVEVL